MTGPAENTQPEARVGVNSDQAVVRRIGAEQIVQHLRAEQKRLGWCSGDNEHWHGGMQSAADAVQELFEAEPEGLSIYDEIHAEREAAHAKHGETSMEAAPVDAMFRAVILGEEVGEVAEVAYLLWSAALTAKASYVQKAMNDGRHDGAVNLAKLRRELVQVATMAAAWADRIPSVVSS